jgi:hypothetical protein
MELKDSWSALGVTEWLTGHTSIAVVKRHKKSLVSYILHILAMDLQAISQIWQICEYHHTLGYISSNFIIPTTGIYAALVESSRNLNLPFYFYKINFNSILPSIFGLNLPKNPLQVFKENFVYISQLPRKITEVQPSLVTAVLIKFLKTHTSYSGMFTISLHSKWCSYTL